MSKKNQQDPNRQSPKPVKKAVRVEDLPPLWRPTWAWHRKTLIIIYATVVVLFLLAKVWLKPYVRELPPEITPWLHQNKTPDGLTR